MGVAFNMNELRYRLVCLCVFVCVAEISVSKISNNTTKILNYKCLCGL